MRNKFNRVIRSTRLRVLAWIAISTLLLYLALRNVNLGDVWQTLLGADKRFIGLAIFSVGLNILIKAIRWHVLVGQSQKAVGFGRLTMSLMTGQTLNWFVPGRVGDLSRAYVVGGMGPGKSFVLGTVAVEKVVDMFSYVLLFIFALLLLPLPSWLSNSGYTLTAVTILVIIGVVLLASYPDWFVSQIERLTFWLPDDKRSKIITWINSGLSSLGVLRQRPRLLKLAVFSAIVWGTAIWTNHLTALALGLHLPLTAALVLLVILQAGISLPGVPGRIGIFQYLCILALALFGIDQATGLSYGILLQAIILLPATLVSLVFFGFLGLGPSKINLLGASEGN